MDPSSPASDRRRSSTEKRSPIEVRVLSPSSDLVNPRPRSPVKLTPLEKKERDRQRQKEQARRRIQFLHERDEQARDLLNAQHRSSQWHQNERMEEELVLRRLVRDIVDAQKVHPATAGYHFTSSLSASDTALRSPVFIGYSPAICPPSQAPRPIRRGGQTIHPAATRHPSFSGYCVAPDHDPRLISPTFFFVDYLKIPLDEVDMGEDDGHDNSDDEMDEESDAIQTQEQFFARQLHRSGHMHAPTLAKLTPTEKTQLQNLLDSRFLSTSGENCLICHGQSATGCPGCFEFSTKEYHAVQSEKSTQRLKTPKTHLQELEDRTTRHRALRWKLMGFGMRDGDGKHLGFVDDGDGEDDHDHTEQPRSDPIHDYYVSVLADIHGIRKHRTVIKNYITLHIKTLPVGNLVTLQVDLKATIAYVYELYRANIDSPNRKIHLVLPTTTGLFYLNELIEAATDTRVGLVNGEFLIEDFNLQDRADPMASPLAKRTPIRTSPPRPAEYLLFSVAILSEENTPRLVVNYLQQNFQFDPREFDPRDNGLRIEYATCRLPRAVHDDVCQRRLIPHVHQMKEFARTSKLLERQEFERERERQLWIAYQERKLAKLELKRRQNQLNSENGRRSRKVIRAMAYFDFVLESTRNPHRANVVEERLEKLWQCFQFFEEWKICKAGRLIDAESTPDTRQLLQNHQETTIGSFDKMLGRGSGAGPLVYPILCVGGSRRLVVKIGVRLGCSASENHEYGLILELDRASDERTPAAAIVVDSNERKNLKQRGFTKKNLAAMANEEAKRQELAGTWRCPDFEWRVKTSSSSSNSMLFAGSDLLRPPFYQCRWDQMLRAYKHVLESLVFQVAKLEEYNALAKVLQNEDAALGKAQIEKWARDVDRFYDGLVELSEATSPALKNSALLHATRRVLQKKGVALLKKRLRLRKRQMREREEELERLRRLQEENQTPKLSVIEQMKQLFIKEKAPKINAILELTPAERLKARTEQLVGRVAATAHTVAEAAKKEYRVRAL